jgi:hypothetical protein
MIFKEVGLFFEYRRAVDKYFEEPKSTREDMIKEKTKEIKINLMKKNSFSEEELEEFAIMKIIIEIAKELKPISTAS